MAFDKKEMFSLANSMKGIDFGQLVQRITCQTLIICGKKDRANLKSAYYLHQHIKTSDLNIMEHTGHVVNEENPKLLAQILNEYYAQHT